MVPKTVQVRARRLNKELRKIPNERLGVFLKIFGLALECGIDPFAPSTGAAGVS
jgi:hypothetical protein